MWVAPKYKTKKEEEIPQFQPKKTESICITANSNWEHQELSSGSHFDLPSAPGYQLLLVKEFMREAEWRCAQCLRVGWGSRLKNWRNWAEIQQVSLSADVM